MSTGKIDIIDEFYEVNFEKEKKSQQETMEKLLNTTQEEKERFYKIKYFYTIWLQKNYDCYSTELDHNFLFDEAIKIETYGGTKNLLITKWLDNTSKYPPKVIILIKFNKDGEVIDVNKENSTPKDRKILQDKYNEFLNSNKEKV